MQKYFNKKKITYQIVGVYLLLKVFTIIICGINFLFLWNIMFQKEYLHAFKVMKSIFLVDLTEHNKIFQSIVFEK